MTRFLETLASGLSLSAIYALIALGFVIVYKASEVVNFAHGSFVVGGSLVVALTHSQIGFFPALLLGIGAGALLALAVERLFVRPIRMAPVVSLAVLTIGVDIILATEFQRRIGDDTLSLGGPWGNSVMNLGAFSVPVSQVTSIVVVTMILAVFFLAFKYTGWGIAMRASAEDGETADLLGVRPSRVSASTWIVAGALATIAGVFLTAFPNPGLDSATGSAALVAFPAAIIGGMDSTTGAVVGGLLVGISQAFAGGYQEYLSFLGNGFSSVMPYVVMLLVLVVRPSGLLGTRELSRV